MDIANTDNELVVENEPGNVHIFSMAIRRLTDSYRFPGFHPRQGVHGIFGDPKARVVYAEPRKLDSLRG